ncbi:MAG: UDP-N-acetylglucosamine 2-epimerase [Gammaproteobacteria bacterium]
MIHFVVGTRAQIFKMAPVMLECQKRGLEWRWIYVAQHKETIKQTIDTFGLPNPDFTVVNRETEADTPGKYGLWMMQAFWQLLRTRRILAGYTGKKHIVLTHGDTTSTVWGALLGRLGRCHVMHVESGLRSFNIFEPFPEELNRLFTFRLATVFATPGDWAANNVRKHHGIKLNTRQNTQADTIAFGIKNIHKINLDLPGGKYVVVTIHRYENVFNKKRLGFIVAELEKIAEQFKVLFVCHPVTQIQLTKFGYDNYFKRNKNIEIYQRMEYLPFVKLITHAEFVITDGGGAQEELYQLGVPTLLFRNATERQEGINETAMISKLNPEIIKDFVQNYIQYRKEPRILKDSPSQIIVDFLEDQGFSSTSGRD